MKLRERSQKILQSYWFWYGVGVTFASIISTYQIGPGYMDAAYYTVGALQIFEGRGLYEPYIWNYLNQPEGIPTPAFIYWMPLPSFVAFVGMWIAGASDFVWAKVPFVLLSGFVPVLSILIARRLLKNPLYAYISGGLAAFPGIYSVYLAIPESFVLYMLGGGLFIAVAFFFDHPYLSSWESPQRLFLLGAIAGWMHLARADGLIWLISALGLFAWRAAPWQSFRNLRIAITSMGFIMSGYLLLMGWWYYRNFDIFGSLIPPGNSKSVWLTSYNQLYSYPSDHLTLSYWLKSGWDTILQARLDALLINLQNLLAVQASVVLLPLVALGIFVRRREAAVKFGLLMWAWTLVIMTFLFPFAGSRGGFLHSGAAIQVWLWSVAVIGLEEAVNFLKKAQGWSFSTSMRIFGTFLILINLGIGIWFFNQRVIGHDHSPIWNQSLETYQKIGQVMIELGISENSLGMVNNPPGFYWATRRSSIVIPDGNIKNAMLAAKKFGVHYLLLEKNQENLFDLYQFPADNQYMKYIGTWYGVHLFEIQDTHDGN